LRRLLALSLLVIMTLTACGDRAGQQQAGGGAPPLPSPPPPTAAESPGAPSPAPPAAAPGLSIAEVQSWCSEVRTGSGACHARFFEQLVETYGIVNPNGVHFDIPPEDEASAPARFNVPAGISVDVWDCFNPSRVYGPAVLQQVCGASFRREP
jgi:hypothetical protein